MTHAPSLLRRIVARLTLTTLAAIVLAYGLLWRDMQSTIETMRSRSLLDRAHAIARNLAPNADGTVNLGLPSSVILDYERSKGADRFSIRDNEGAFLVGTGGLTAPPPSSLADPVNGRLYDYDDDGSGPPRVFGLALPVVIGEHLLVIQVERKGGGVSNLTETVANNFFEGHGWLAGVFLLALLGVSVATVRSSLSPLRQVSRQAEAVGPTTTSIRLDEADVPMEIQPLVRAVNRAFDRLEDGFRILREFTADAAHELRTPLAILNAHIDSLPDREVAKGLRRDLDTMTRLVGQLLTVAQIEALVLATEQQADLNAIAADVTSWMALMAVKAGKSIEVVGTDAPIIVHGNGEAIFHALRNLVENALSHTPPGTTVTIAVADEPPSISVRDQGPGVPEDIRDRIFQRFWRNRRQSSGSGLGLAIVKQTMETHHGHVRVVDAEGGGALFILEFPPGQVSAVS